MSEASSETWKERGPAVWGEGKGQKTKRRKLHPAELKEGGLEEHSSTHLLLFEMHSFGKRKSLGKKCQLRAREHPLYREWKAHEQSQAMFQVPTWPRACLSPGNLRQSASRNDGAQDREKLEAINRIGQGEPPSARGHQRSWGPASF